MTERLKKDIIKLVIDEVVIEGEKLKIAATIPLPNKIHEREIAKTDLPDTFNAGATLGPINQTKMERIWNKPRIVEQSSLRGRHKKINPVRNKTPLASADSQANRISNGVHTTLKPKVFVAMSGGVDSSVAAALLKRDGFDVTGMYIKCWTADDPFGENCTSTDDERMARLAAEKIGIPFYSLNLISEYKEKVVEYLLDGYRQGITPNPDVMCNKEIKFGLFFDKARELGSDFGATGHYARVAQKDGQWQIFAGKDPNKDQSYFLSFIRPEVLERVMFPIGEYTKPEVRAMARRFGLPNAERKDSQGICFVGKLDFTEFLKKYIPVKPGVLVNKEGRVLGKHQGAAYYTVGQRKGIGLSGGPYYVVATDVQKNVVIVSKNENDLYQKEVKVKSLNWFGAPRTRKPMEVKARIRYRQTPAPSVLTLDSTGKRCTLVFKEAQRAVTSGQLAVFYEGDRMLAGGVIE